MKVYRAALMVAALEAYEREIVDAGLEAAEIGDGKRYQSKDHWVNVRAHEWCDQAFILGYTERRPPPGLMFRVEHRSGDRNDG